MIAALAALVLANAGCTVPNPTQGQTLPDGYTAPPAHSVIRDVAYGPGPTQLLDIYRPHLQKGGVILFLHSGGWCCGAKENVSQGALRQVSRGWVVVSVEYALSSWPAGAPAAVNPFPAALHDTKRAIRYLKAHGASHGINPSVIVPWGESAGGTLAVLAAVAAGTLEPTGLPPALAAQDSTVRAAISLAGPLAFEHWLAVQHPWVPGLGTAFLGCATLFDVTSCDPAVVAAASAHTHYDVADPPVYLAQGEVDPLVPPSQGIPLALAYLSTGRELLAWADLVDGFGHNLENGVNTAFIDLYLDLILAAAAGGGA
jgi:acetyl esterase/lipase